MNVYEFSQISFAAQARLANTDPRSYRELRRALKEKRESLQLQLLKEGNLVKRNEIKKQLDALRSPQFPQHGGDAA